MKYVILFASLAIHTCIGGLYAWSEFVPALSKSHGLSTAQTQLIFGCLVGVFTLSMIAAGRLMGRLGPRAIAAIGGLLFGSGYWLASCSSGHFGLLLLCISGMAGVGTGFCYVCPIAMCAKWFPRRKGLATGIAVAGFGGGAVLLVILAERWFADGLEVLDIFERVGLLYGGTIVLASLPLRFPDGMDEKASRFNFMAVARDRYFWGLFAGMFGGTFAGLLVVGNLKPLLQSKSVDPSTVTVAISAFAVGNAAGRILWGWVADRLKHGAILLSLMFLAFTLLLSMFLLNSKPAAIGLSAAMGAGFGACFVVYAAQVSSHYGTNHVASIYPLVFLGYGISGLFGPWIGGWIYDSTKSYQGGLVVGIIAVLLSAGWISFCHASAGIGQSPVAE